MASSRRHYPFHLIEPKWQNFWDQEQTFRAWNPGDLIPRSHPFAQRHSLGAQADAQSLPPKFYVLDMFPYPSGAGLHVGHPEGYTATDILARYRRATGYNVLHPLGWDAFGLPAEQYAIKTGQHPRITTQTNIANFKRQIQSLGFSYDWSREIDTTDPRYFRWTQWIFLQLYQSWFNPVTQKAEPISTLPIPEQLTAEAAIRQYRDQRRLAYVAEAPVNWCPELGTVLANEEVIDGRSEVGGYPVIRKPMRQWMLRITAYAERLLRDLDSIDWSNSLKEMQRNWIGRSAGAEVVFRLADHPGSITVFTTRPDTLFGATYMVLAPEHRLIDLVVAPDQKDTVAAYRTATAAKSDLERTELAKEKTGVFTGAWAINPVNQERIPIWIADYVLLSYGTGAIMAVPAHDTRDLEFARKFNLPIRIVVQAPADVPSLGFVEDGLSINSDFLNGLPTPEAKRCMTSWLTERGLGKPTVQYKLRDWLFSRQRYWGEPFPIAWSRGHHEALSESDLPVLPPELTDYKPTPTGEPPLTRAQSWVQLPDGRQRETNTMPQWAGSCWYYLRYLDAHNTQTFCSQTAEHYWMGRTSTPENPATPGVDLYVGGTEHAVLHLLYARFWHKVLFDLGHVSSPEPFHRLVNQGLILGEMEYTAFSHADGTLCTVSDLRDIAEEATPQGPRLAGIHRVTGEKIPGRRVSEDEIEKHHEGFCLKTHPEIRVDARSFKMSKSRGNVINPDDILSEYGADAFRLYEMFLGPLEMVKPWSTRGVEGVYRFLGRVWRLFIDEASDTESQQTITLAPDRASEALCHLRLDAAIQEVAPSRNQLKTLHLCIRKVTEDLDHLRFNTAISALMVFVNDANAWKVKPAAVLRTFLILLQPFAPHLAEELFQKLSRQFSGQDAPNSSMAYEPWPSYDASYLVEETLALPVQVNGKLRDRIVVAASATQDDIERAALANEKVVPFLGGKPVRKVIIVPKRLVNLVT